MNVLLDQLKGYPCAVSLQCDIDGQNRHGWIPANYPSKAESVISVVDVGGIMTPWKLTRQGFLEPESYTREGDRDRAMIQRLHTTGVAERLLLLPVLEEVEIPQKPLTHERPRGIFKKQVPVSPRAAVRSLSPVDIGRYTSRASGEPAHILAYHTVTRGGSYELSDTHRDEQGRPGITIEAAMVLPEELARRAFAEIRRNALLVRALPQMFLNEIRIETRPVTRPLPDYDVWPSLGMTNVRFEDHTVNPPAYDIVPV